MVLYVFYLQKTLIIIGIVSFVLGIILEIFAPFIHCYPQCYGIRVSQTGYGLWCGLVVNMFQLYT